ncbi:MAG: hypothetical protein GY938_29515, partial [Ketobacter sp.]|nr:hypothetical protein [Ketobacter sp.]
MAAPTIYVSGMVFIIGIIQWIVFMETFVTNCMNIAYFIDVFINYTFITIVIDVQQILTIMTTNCTYFMIIICIIDCYIIFYAIFIANRAVIIQNSITVIKSVIVSVNLYIFRIRIATNDIFAVIFAGVAGVCIGIIGYVYYGNVIV